MCDPLPTKQILLIVSVHVNEVLYIDHKFLQKNSRHWIISSIWYFGVLWSRSALSICQLWFLWVYLLIMKLSQSIYSVEKNDFYPAGEGLIDTMLLCPPKKLFALYSC